MKLNRRHLLLATGAAALAAPPWAWAQAWPGRPIRLSHNNDDLKVLVTQERLKRLPRKVRSSHKENAYAAHRFNPTCRFLHCAQLALL